jgi:alpha-ketoglutarate-dependent 2,4-dichlorophenoxyacetate dioxygenase
MTIQIAPFNTDFVATVSGIDLSQPLNDSECLAIERAIWEYGVLIFRGQPLTPDEQLAFARSFGPLETALSIRHADADDQQTTQTGVLDLSNVSPKGRFADKTDDVTLINAINRIWHSDGLGLATPFRYSILSAQSAVSWGGETQFADLRAAYDALDERTRQLVAEKTAVFSFSFPRQVFGMSSPGDDDKQFPAVRWPLVRTHAGSSRKLLWVDSKLMEIPGMTLPESRILAIELLEHITQRERVHTHTWHTDDVVMWDNRSVLHRGRRFDPTERRAMRRVSTLDDMLPLPSVKEETAV